MCPSLCGRTCKMYPQYGKNSNFPNTIAGQGLLHLQGFDLQLNQKNTRGIPSKRNYFRVVVIVINMVPASRNRPKTRSQVCHLPSNTGKKGLLSDCRKQTFGGLFGLHG